MHFDLTDSKITVLCCVACSTATVSDDQEAEGSRGGRRDVGDATLSATVQPAGRDHPLGLGHTSKHLADHHWTDGQDRLRRRRWKTAWNVNWSSGSSCFGDKDNTVLGDTKGFQQARSQLSDNGGPFLQVSNLFQGPVWKLYFPVAI